MYSRPATRSGSCCGPSGPPRSCSKTCPIVRSSSPSPNVAAQFETAGLKPAGTDGSFFQPVPLRKVDLEPGKSSLSLTRNDRTQILTYAKDYQLGGWVANNFKDAETTVTAPMVFVAYG